MNTRELRSAVPRTAELKFHVEPPRGSRRIGTELNYQNFNVTNFVLAESSRVSRPKLANSGIHVRAIPPGNGKSTGNCNEDGERGHVQREQE